MKAYVFPGQGSQRKGMGEGLFDEFPDLIRQADEVLGYSIRELCLTDPEQKLNQTQFTQPALYTVNALSYLKRANAGAKPDFLAGHSLGEYNALHAAGVFSFEEGLKLVKRRGELMSQALPGAMAAVINCPEERLIAVLADAGLDTIDIANLNSPSQIIISGLKEDVAKAQGVIEKADANFIPLNTSGAFHSRYMRDSANEFRQTVSQCRFSIPQTPVIANVSGRPYDGELIVQNLVDQIASPVRWTDSVVYLLDQGVTAFEEMGVGDVLTKLIGQIKRAWKKKPAKATAAAPAIVAPEAVGSTDVQELVAHWNRNHPVGSMVTSDQFSGELRTRTEARVLFGHRAAVYMEGYNGYFDLRELRPNASAPARTSATKH